MVDRPPRTDASQIADADSGDHRFTDGQRNQRLRELLQWELRKVRAEASAASLTAQAAELEVRLRELSLPTKTSSADEGRRSDLANDDSSGQQFSTTTRGDSSAISSAPKLGGWSDVEAALGLESIEGPSRSGDAPVHRFDAPAGLSPPKHRRLVEVESAASADATADAETDVEGDSGVNARLAGENAVADVDSVSTDLLASIGQTGAMEASFDSPSMPLDRMPLDIDDDAAVTSRRRPTAFVVSAIVHGLLLLMLALIGFQTHQPKDQIAITSVASEASETTFETMTIENVEPQDQPVEDPQPTAAEFEAELSPVGTTPIGKPNLDVAPSFAPPMASLASMASTASLSKLTSKSKAKMEFCGVEGGGNHFVYLVDSSRSMRDGYQSARAELLHSLGLLQPNQRFYVIFFDAEPDYMRITNPAADERRSVRATPENKAALKRWVMTVKQDLGRNPADTGVLEFALELKPDVIFLLSDGEFPQRVETLLQDQNKIENLFDQPRPISIVHTIGYHSRDGEAAMKRIAAQNDGQYRYVPK